MSAARLNFFVILNGLALASGVFVALFFVSAPYGRHIRRGCRAFIGHWSLSAPFVVTASAVLSKHALID